MSLQEIPVPEVKGKQVNEVDSTGICGTDIHTFKGEYANAVTPISFRSRIFR